MGNIKYVIQREDGKYLRNYGCGCGIRWINDVRFADNWHLVKEDYVLTILRNVNYWGWGLHPSKWKYKRPMKLSIVKADLDGPNAPWETKNSCIIKKRIKHKSAVTAFTVLPTDLLAGGPEEADLSELPLSLRLRKYFKLVNGNWLEISRREWAKGKDSDYVASVRP